MDEGSGHPVRLELIPMWDLEEHWESVAPLLAKAIAKQTAMTLESVHADVKGAKFHLWHIPGKAAFVTQIQNFPSERICMIVLCGGEGMDEWLRIADETLTRYARSFGCNAMMIVGREGWSRVIPAYEVTDVVMRKAL